MPPLIAPAAAEAPKKKTWKPSFIYIQGYCTDWKTREGAIKQKQVYDFVRGFFVWLGQWYPLSSEAFDRPATARKSSFIFNTRIVFKLGLDITGDAAYELKDIVNKYIQENEIGIPKELSYAGVEASPWRKPLRKLGGMACGLMERKGVARGKLRPDLAHL